MSKGVQCLPTVLFIIIQRHLYESLNNDQSYIRTPKSFHCLKARYENIIENSLIIIMNRIRFYPYFLFYVFIYTIIMFRVFRNK